MSSLHNELRAGIKIFTGQLPVELGENLRAYHADRTLVFANIQECADDCLDTFRMGVSAKTLLRGLELPIVPTHEKLWMEFGQSDCPVGRVGVQMLTDGVLGRDGFRRVRLYGWAYTGIAGASALLAERSVLRLTPEGLFHSWNEFEYCQEDLANSFPWAAPFLALMQMNASNVTVETVAKQRVARKVRDDRKFSEWRTLCVDSDPKTIYRGVGEPEHEGGIVKFHWCRGHFRRIPGHAKPIWIKWHRRGNPELGEVVPSYHLKARAAA